MINPTPLFFRVPKDELDGLLRAHSAQLGPDFLCFEAFYQAVATTWPKDFTVIDIGGFIGVQGWLFEDFRRYINVDVFSGRRCKLPDNGYQVRRDGFSYLRQFVDSEANTSRILFLCSAVPDKDLRSLVSQMPNNVVWYPWKPMTAFGELEFATYNEFRCLNDSGWNEEKDKMVWEAISDGYLGEI